MSTKKLLRTFGTMTKENLNFIPKFDESKGIGFGIYTLGDHIKKLILEKSSQRKPA